MWNAPSAARRGISLVDDKIKYDWPEDNGDRLTVLGKFTHMREIAYHHEQYEENQGYR